MALTVTTRLNRETLEWSIQQRAETLTTALKLRGLMAKNMGKDSAVDRDLRSLAAVSFSLWRAVFLADRTRDASVKNQQSISFIDTMIATNSITFSDDRNCKEWTFVYYIENASARLQRLAEDRPRMRLDVFAPRGGKSTEQWDRLQKAFSNAVTYFEVELSAP